MTAAILPKLRRLLLPFQNTFRDLLLPAAMADAAVPEKLTQASATNSPAENVVPTVEKAADDPTKKTEKAEKTEKINVLVADDAELSAPVSSDKITAPSASAEDPSSDKGIA